MNVFKQGRLSAILLLCTAQIFQSYVPVGPVQKKYQTASEKRKLFKEVGCKYSNNLAIEYPKFKEIIAKESDLYRDDKDRYDAYAQRYAGAVEAEYRAPMYLKWISDVVGYGVFAAHDIKKGDLVGEYCGVLREIQDAPDNLDYAWYYTLDGVGGKKLVIDGKNQGNELRFINHANHPNTVRIDVLDKNNIFRVVYKALQDIKKDEQLTVSYGDGYFSSRGMKVEEV